MNPVESAAAIAPIARFQGRRTMQVVGLRQETTESVVIDLEDTSQRPVSFLPGQYLTLIVPIDGVEHRRSYSICSSGEGGTVSVACKRVENGRVSTYLTRQLAPGDKIDVLGPSGTFTLRTDPRSARKLLLIGGGSGITPLMAILKAALETEPLSQVTLVYGNRAPQDTLFAGALARLTGRYCERLTVRHVVEQPPETWTGGVGRLDHATFSAELTGLGFVAADPKAEAYICGPEPMMQSVSAVLAERGMAPERIRMERFTPVAKPAQANNPPATSGPHPLSIRRGLEVQTVTVLPGQTVLEGANAKAELIPWSCQSGTCGSCRVRLVNGTVRMEEGNCLTSEQRAAGHMLACVSKPLSPLEVEMLEEEV